MIYDRVADLPLEIARLDRERFEQETTSGFTRATTVLSLSGAGETGRGEDVTYDFEEHDPERWDRLDLDLAGEYTLESFSALLESRELFPSPPDREVFDNYRRWGVESAALDLALRQADTTLGERLDRRPRPVQFVVSTRLADVDDDTPPTAGRVRRFLERDPTLEFKLDPTPDWPESVIEELAGTGAVRTLDFKGHYEGTEVDTPPDPDLYERLLSAFPDALIEDPALTDEVRAALEGHQRRVSWDAPIHGIDDVEARPFEPDWLNIKPSRFGTVERLFETIEYCRERSIQLYGGGQFELDVGRRQLQTLAALFYPEAPNDVAPGGYNDPDYSGQLPSSPLDPPVPDRGF